VHRSLATFAAIVVAGVGLVLVLTAQPRERPPRPQLEQRVKEPYIASTKMLTDGETVRVLVIPHPLGEFFDTVCVLYTHRDFGAATMSCPNGHQGEISVPEAERRLWKHPN
jgi:hypothetical protein